MSRDRVALVTGLIAASLCLNVSAQSQSQKLTPLSIRDAIAVRDLPSLVRFSLSSDGQQLAYTIRDDWRKSKGKPSPINPSFTILGSPIAYVGCDIWVSNTRTGEAINITGGKGGNFLPAWSPDGQRLAFYSDRDGALRIWIWERHRKVLRRASTAVLRPNTIIDSIKWTPDGNQVIAFVLSDGITPDDAVRIATLPPADVVDESSNEAGSTARIYSTKATANTNSTEKIKLDTSFSFKHLLCDLSLIDVTSGRVMRLIKNVTPTGRWISPDGKKIAFANAKGLVKNKFQPVYDLVTVSTTDGSSRVVAADLQMRGGYAASWSPDSRQIAYVTLFVDAGKLRSDCFVTSADEPSPINLTNVEHPSFSAEFIEPLWSHDNSRIYLTVSNKARANEVWVVSLKDRSANKLTTLQETTVLELFGSSARDSLKSGEQQEDSLVAATRGMVDKKSGFFRVDTRSGMSTRLIEDNAGFDKYVISRDGRSLVYSSQNAAMSEDIWMIDLQTLERRRLTQINPQFDNYVMGRSRVIEWLNSKGEKLKGAILLPAGYQEGRRYPLVVYQYPPTTMSDNANNFGLGRFSGAMENWQLLATRGYAILLADCPTYPNTGRQMQEIAEAVIPGVDKAVELGIADPARLGVIGHSAGGFGVLSLIVQTNKFAAAVDLSGYGDKVIVYGQLAVDGSSTYTGQIEQILGGTPWEQRERYIQNSPFFFLDKVTTPLLIIHGTSDPYVPEVSADSVFVGLRRLGKTAVYAKYVGEGHAPSNWSYANQVDYLNRMISWFDKYLKAPQKVSGNLSQ